MVQKIINNIFIDGQLDECELTLKDLHNIAKSFNRVLSDKGYRVVTAENAQEALAELRKEEYDVVYTDIRMPGMDGVEFAERVKARRPWTSVIIVTGYGTTANEERAKAVGVSAFLHKPLSPTMIEQSAATVLETHAIAPEPVVCWVESMKRTRPKSVRTGSKSSGSGLPRTMSLDAGCQPFPFEAFVHRREERGPLKTGDRAKVVEITDVDEMYGIIVHLRAGHKSYYLPLCELEVADDSSPNSEPVDDYSVWFANR